MSYGPAAFCVSELSLFPAICSQCRQSAGRVQAWQAVTLRNCWIYLEINAVHLLTDIYLLTFKINCVELSNVYGFITLTCFLIFLIAVVPAK